MRGFPLMAIAMLTASLAIAASPAVRLKTTVGIDPKSGRLVRSTTVIVPRVVAPRVVAAKTIETRQQDFASSNASAKRIPVVVPPAQIRRIVEEKARQHGIDPLLVDSVIQVESAYNPYAISPKGAQGLMQLMPDTARTLGVRNALDPADNIDGGIRYLKYLKTLFDDERLVLAAYNAGEGAVQRYGWIPPYNETQNYVYKVGQRYGQARRDAWKTQAPVPAQVSGREEVKAAAEEAKPAPPKPIEQFVDAEGRVHLVIRED